MVYLGVFCLVYGLIVVVAGILKNEFIIKITKMKLGKNMSDERAVTILYVFGAIMAVIGVVLLVVNS